MTDIINVPFFDCLIKDKDKDKALFYIGFKNNKH